MIERELDPTHPRPEALVRASEGDSSRDEAAELVRHLLSGCEVCAQSLQDALSPSAPSESPAGLGGSDPATAMKTYGPGLDRARRLFQKSLSAFQEERVQARRELDRLAKTPLDQWEPLLLGEPRFQTWALVLLLLEECQRLYPRNPAHAFELSRLADLLSQRLDEERYGKQRLFDLRARTQCALGTVHRINTDYHEAEGHFQRAKELLEAGTGDPIEKAEILIHEAVLNAHQARYSRAFALLEHATRIARRFEDRHLEGKALVTKGVYLSFVDQEEKALQALYTGIELLDTEREPRLLLVAWHNIFFCLSYVGRNEEALQKLPYVRSLHEKFGNRMDLLRLHWVEARIKADFGHWHEAEKAFKAVREAFIEAGIGYEAAQVSLDLASLYLRQGRSDRVAGLAREMLPIFKSRDVHREALAALLVFQQAVEQETFNSQLVAEIEQYLRQARNDPSLRFQPSS